MQVKLGDYTPRQIIGLFTISALMLIENIDAHILNVAIPQMATTFATSIFTLKLAVTSYLIGLSIFIPISGWVADRLGTRNTLSVSILLFSLASWQCGLTNSITWLVICRLLQGFAGAFMVPVGRLLLLKLFNKQQMVKAYTIMGMPVILGPIFAPILGGYLVSYFSWRWIFWVNLPLGFLALLATIKYIENYTAPQERFNWLTFIWLALFIGGFCFWLDISLLEQIATRWKLFCLGAALISGAIYYFLERQAAHPVIRYRLFKLRTFSVSFWSNLIIRAALGGRAFALAIFLELSFHLSAFQAGFYFIFMACGVLSSRNLIRRGLNHFGFRRFISLANYGSSLVLLMIAMVSHLNWFFCLSLFLNGAFVSAQFMSFNVLYYAEVANQDYGSAVSLAATWQQLSSSLGVIIAAGLLHFFNYLTQQQFSLTTFHACFIGLALLNLSCQLLINRLQPNDGGNLLKVKVAS